MYGSILEHRWSCYMYTATTKIKGQTDRKLIKHFWTWFHKVQIKTFENFFKKLATMENIFLDVQYCLLWQKIKRSQKFSNNYKYVYTKYIKIQMIKKKRKISVFPENYHIFNSSMFQFYTSEHSAGSLMK